MLSRSMSRSSSHTMPQTISIIGAGRVGQTIAKRLRKLGWQIGAVVTRSRQPPAPQSAPSEPERPTPRSRPKHSMPM